MLGVTRRRFFRLIGLATVTAPATAALVPEKLASVRQWWAPTGWWSKEFDFGRYIGVAGAFTNALTGEVVRHGVRMDLVQPPAGVTFTQALSETEARGKSFLVAWSKTLPSWRRPLRRGHGHFDDVLEGREARIA